MALSFSSSHVTVGASELHVVQAGDPSGPVVLFLHGWPQSWESWRGVMTAAPPGVRTIAIDLPGVGESRGDPTDGSKPSWPPSCTASPLR